MAVEVRGCFWHGCPDHHRPARTNAQFWADKIATNIARDRAKDEALAAAGWLVLVVWEHEDTAEAAQTVIDAVNGRRHAQNRRGPIPFS